MGWIKISRYLSQGFCARRKSWKEGIYLESRKVSEYGRAIFRIDTDGTISKFILSEDDGCAEDWTLYSPQSFRR